MNCYNPKNRHSKECMWFLLPLYKVIARVRVTLKKEKAILRKCKRISSKINKLYVTVTFTVGFLSALLTPVLCIYEKVANVMRGFIDI